MTPAVAGAVLALTLALGGCSGSDAADLTGLGLPAASAAGSAAAPGVIAFVDRDGSGDPEIWTVRPDGSGRRKLTNNTTLDTEPAVSPDGRRIAWTGERDQGNVDIFVMNVDGSAKKRLTRHIQPDSDPTFSPDGRTIAFRSDRRAGAAEIWTMTVDGKHLRRLTDAGPDELQSFQPSFGPDGRIVFTSDRDLTPPLGSRNEIWVMGCDGSAPLRLTDNRRNDSTPAWSPRGDRIAFWSNEAESNIDIWSIRPDGTDRRRLTTDEGNDLEPAFSPDGTHIAFRSTRDGGDEENSGDDTIWVMAADGSSPRRVTPGSLPSWGPAPGKAGATGLSCQDQSGFREGRKSRENGPEVTQDTPLRAV